MRRAWFKDPTSGQWHELVWEHAAGLNAPFSADAVAYAKELAAAQKTAVDPAGAVQDLLAGLKRGEVTARRDRNLARRLASQTGPTSNEGGVEGAVEAREVASLPGVVDLLERRARRAAPPDDLDVFEVWGSPEGRFEVFDE